ncbi:MAG TPA: M56 family metallopeptidase [Mobilitalea sp.]|nr:M56 family metallopeptidase [Mobilitalea sp.]
MIETMITSSVLIAVIIAIRYLFAGKINRRLQYALWGLVLLRLCLPFTLLSSPISVMNAVSIDEVQYETNASLVQTGTLREDSQEQSSVEDVIKTSGRIETGFELKNNSNTSTTLGEVFTKVWIIGSIAIGLWFAGTNLRFYLLLRNSRKSYDQNGCKLPIYLAVGIASPCLFGTLSPAIYLTPKATRNHEMLSYVIAHEMCHYRHGDYIWSALRGLCLAIYWWNPLIWAAAIMSRTDSEFACDEAVIKQIGENNRLAYGRTLIDMIAIKRTPSGLMCVATAMSSQKQGIKQRLNIIINYSKTYVSALIIVIIIATVCVGCTFTGAQGNNKIPEVKDRVSDYARELYDSRNPYIGDAPADGALLNALEISEKLDSFTFELETKEEPYILRLIFTNELIDDGALNSAMNDNAMLLLALIDNASEIQWQYNNVDQSTGGSGISVGSMTIDDATDALIGTDIKGYGQSADKVQDLLDWLDSRSNTVTDNSEEELQNATVSIDRTSLDDCITDAIISAYTDQNQYGDLDTEAHTVLKTVESGNTTTVYAIALHMLFGYAGGGFSEISSSHMPVAIIFEKNTEGEYEVKDYWDGSYHDPSIEEKFPVDINVESKNYVLAHIQACYIRAVEYGNVDTNTEIEKLLDTITSSPAVASNPGAYIDEHPTEYSKLLYYGDYTLRYVFAEFLEGNQTGLKGHIMLAAIRDLIGSEDYTIDADAPQQWFDEWKNNAVRMRDVNSMEYMEKNNPKAYILLQMIMK